MQLPPEVYTAITRAVKQNGQSPQFDARFRKFFENLAVGSTLEADLENLIEAVEVDASPDLEEDD